MVFTSPPQAFRLSADPMDFSDDGRDRVTFNDRGCVALDKGDDVLSA